MSVGYETLVAAVNSGAAAAGISSIMVLPKDVAKGLHDQVKKGRGKCAAGAYNYNDECVRLEDALLRCGANGIGVVANSLSCGGSVRIDGAKLTQTQNSKIEANSIIIEHDMAVTQLQSKLIKSIADLQLHNQTAGLLLAGKFAIAQNKIRAGTKSDAEKNAALVNNDSAHKISEQVLSTKLNESLLKLQQIIGAAFAKLIETTLARLDRTAKSKKILYRVQFKSGAIRVAGLRKVGQKKRTRRTKKC